ncbi:MAG TPA: MFS transporter [Caulobacteraceae bacterium]|nr:MFS transporter [Caulobacteraceae bacterium]
MSAIALDEPAGPISPPAFLPLRKVAAVGIGNALSFYDFLTYSFFAIQIGHTFFPGGDASHSLLYSLATFGVGFATRPLGGLIIGAYADRAGRKPAMILSFTLMGLGILGLALTPSYAQIGVAAPALLVFFRLMQGFALGGEVGPSTAFLIEAAPPLRRGLYLALQYATQDFAVLIAGLVGFILSSVLAPADLQGWGWRLAFLIGAAIVPFGLVMRRSLPETLFHAPAGSGAAAPARRRLPVKILVLGLAMLGAGTIANYALGYLTTYAQDSLHLAASIAFGATIVLGAAAVICDIACGLMSDKLGRKPVMVISGVAFTLLSVPAFLMMVRAPSVWTLWGATALLSALLSFMSGPALITITESLPRGVRSGALGTLYAVAIAGFGGSTQFLIKWLTDVTGSPLAPAWYMTGAMAIGTLAMILTRETAPVKTGVHDDLA